MMLKFWFSCAGDSSIISMQVAKVVCPSHGEQRTPKVTVFANGQSTVEDGDEVDDPSVADCIMLFVDRVLDDRDG